MAAAADRMSARLFAPQSFEVDEWWPYVEHHIQRWIDVDDTWTSVGVLEELRAARAQLWFVHADGAIVGVWVTRIELTDSCSIGLIWGCAGDLKPYKDEAIALFAQTENWFREKGCKFSQWIGRGGWERIFPDYERHAVVMRKRL